MVPDYSGTQVISAESAYLASYLMYQAVSGPIPLHAAIKTQLSDLRQDWHNGLGQRWSKLIIPQGAAKDKWMIASSLQIHQRRLGWL
ncbi:MAG: hypothetical protein ACLSA6_11220 [Holdemania massiliensis]